MKRAQPPRSRWDHKQRGAVQWYAPGVLGKSAVRVLVSMAFGSFLDKRELQTDPCQFIDRSGAPEITIDYLADTGDGFKATYSMAWLLGQRELSVSATCALPRGELLVLGGDEVYPVASSTNYHERLLMPFEGARWEGDDQPTLLAIPGNHDWFDGLSNFMRIFTQGRRVGGRQTVQTRSYFAVSLPHRWWLWGVDIESGAYIDKPQWEFFEKLPVEPGDQVILCCPRPSWLEEGPRAFRNLAVIERAWIQRRGAELALTVAGDLHHYARYSHGGGHKLTAGGGGAFTHPTHNLPESVSVNMSPEAEANPEIVEWTLKDRYPTKRWSRRKLLSLPFVLWALSPSFLWIPAVLNVVLLFGMYFGLRVEGDPQSAMFKKALTGYGFDDLGRSYYSSPSSALLVLVVIALLVAFAKPRPHRQGVMRFVRKLVMGVSHATVQLVTAVFVMLAAVKIVSALDGHWFNVSAVLVTAALGAVAGAAVLGLYLMAWCLPPIIGTHDNEAFAALRSTRHKNFLRMQIDEDGTLHVHVLGVDRICRHWEWRPEGERPRWKPDSAPEVRRIDGFQIPGPGAATPS